MIHQSIAPFGARPVSACLLQGQRIAAAPALRPEIDKWTLFHQLRACRSQFGLTNRDLVVLNALLTFHPNGKLIDGAQLVVFPSNASLSDRAHGMAESTLRRHLATLVNAGIISRNDSPNGKRFAARTRSGTVLQAYGFNLRPFLVQAPKIQALADAADEAALTLKLVRQSVVTKLRDIRKVMAYAETLGLLIGPDAILKQLDDTSKSLRRKVTLLTLQEIVKSLDQILVDITGAIPDETEKMDGYDAENERHQQRSHKENFDYESSKPPTVQISGSDITLNLLLKACPDINDYAPNPIRTWRDLIATANTVYPMMGISKNAWETAKIQMGHEQSAGVLAAMLQRSTDIHVPGGYLRKLVEKHVAGTFSLPQMISSLSKAAIMTAA